MRYGKSGNTNHMKRIIIICFCIMLAAGGCGGSSEWKSMMNALNGNMIFENYEGPILTLNALSDTSGVKAERIINYDFSFYDSVPKEENRIMVNDNYFLTNTTDEDITIKAVYGFAGNADDEVDILPIISVNHQETDAQLVSGRTTGRYVKILEEKGIENANYAASLHTREGYELLLSDGLYLKEAFEPSGSASDLEQSAIVYKFTDVGYDGEELLNPATGVFYTADFSKTNIFTYGVDGFGGDGETEKVIFDVPLKGEADYGKDVYLIIVGEDITITDILYSVNMQTTESNRTDAYALELEKYESALEDILLYLTDEYLSAKDNTVASVMTNEMIFNMHTQFIYDMDYLEKETSGVIGLEHAVFVAPHAEQRIYYQTFDIEIPANESVEVKASFEKIASVSEIDGAAYERYDLLTEPDSAFEFTSQKLTVTGTDYIEYAEYTTGEDLENGIVEVELNEPYFEVLIAVR